MTIGSVAHIWTPQSTGEHVFPLLWSPRLFLCKHWLENATCVCIRMILPCHFTVSHAANENNQPWLPQLFCRSHISHSQDCRLCWYFYADKMSLLEIRKTEHRFCLFCFLFFCEIRHDRIYRLFGLLPIATMSLVDYCIFREVQYNVLQLEAWSILGYALMQILFSQTCISWSYSVRTTVSAYDR